MRLFEHGDQKYPAAHVETSSEQRGWTGLGAEIRAHQAGELPAVRLTQMEIAIATGRSPGARVSRTGNGVVQETGVQPGTTWLCPVGVLEERVRITAPIEVLHIYLPPERFDQLSEVVGGQPVPASSIQYLAGVSDELMRSIGVSVLDEMRVQSAGGRVLVESLAVSLTARLAQRYSSFRQQPIASGTAKRQGREEARLRRVIDYVHAHLEDDIGLDDLASAACMSPFHFSRMFRQGMGITPHRYLANRRLEFAKALLISSDEPVSQIAQRCQFSSQANFGRAFRQFAGVTPGSYRREKHL